MRELALFAGAGGGLLGSLLSGHTTVGAVEIDSYCRRVLLARQLDGMLPRFPIWDDIRTFDGRPWRTSIDLVSGGFPCQDISSAGRGAGLAGERSGLWYEMLRVIGEVRPQFVFAENSPNLRTRGLGTVVEGLAGLGYDSRWCVLGARHVGAPHRRDRMWLLAHTDSTGKRVQPKHGEVARTPGDVEAPLVRGVDIWGAANSNDEELRLSEGRRIWPRGAPEEVCRRPGQAGWSGPPPVARMDDGLAHRMDRTRATGNGQVPAVAALAWRVLIEGLV